MRVAWMVRRKMWWLVLGICAVGVVCTFLSDMYVQGRLGRGGVGGGSGSGYLGSPGESVAQGAPEAGDGRLYGAAVLPAPTGAAPVPV
ncbi:MAG: hypothetical protein LBR77_07745, partial [Lachnospiraceae bacterium]|nr:hypothetical protein [Lachnospiraceae bacterium]